MRFGYDSSVPVKDPPPWQVCSFYIGGDTPHEWTDAEIADQPARFRNPIFVYTGEDTVTAGHDDALKMLAWLDAQRVPELTVVTIDTETGRYDHYLAEMNMLIRRARRYLMNYGSLDAVVHNHACSGGRWAAHWDDHRQVDEGMGIVGDQFANAAMLGTGYDGSVFEDRVPFWDTRPPVPPAVTSWESHADKITARIMGELAGLSGLIRQHIPIGG